MKFLKKLFSCLMCFWIITSSQLSIYGAEFVSIKHKIPIAMATDENYFYPTLIAMISMLENKDKNTHLDFNIMISGEVNEEDIDRMKSLEELYKDCTVRLINMKDDFKDNDTSAITYYRLKLPSVMPKCDKVLYLDGDIIVRKDLWQMYNSSVAEHYVVGVKDFGRLDSGKEYAQRMGISDLNQYVDAGVLIMNLRKMRQDGIEKKFHDYLTRVKKYNLCLNSQDVINAVCYNKIAFLSPEYNAMQHFKFSYDNIPRLVDCYDMGEFKKSCTNPTIVHFSFSHKPWKEHKIRFYGEWDKYRNIVESKLYDKPAIKDGTYTISSALNEDKVLDISGGSKHDGANLQLWSRGNNVAAQKFKFRYVGEGCYEIEAICSGKMIDVEFAGKNKGTNVWQYKKNDTKAQRWIVKSAGDGYYSIISKCNGLCLDVDNAETTNGTNIQMWEYNATKAQRFRISKTK